MNRTFPELPAETEDFRTGNAIHSRFRDILLISVLSVICSMDTSAETAMFAIIKEISGSGACGFARFASDCPVGS